MSATPADADFGPRIRNLRIAQGLPVKNCAKTAKVSITTWNRWEQGTRTPGLWRAGMIANALGCPVAALVSPEGFVAVTDVQLTPAAVARVRNVGLTEAVRISDQIAAQLPALILAQCRTTQRPSADARGKPRRTRAEVLAGIAEANAMRANKRFEQTRSQQGGVQGNMQRNEGGLPGVPADSLTAEP